MVFDKSFQSFLEVDAKIKGVRFVVYETSSLLDKKVIAPLREAYEGVDIQQVTLPALQPDLAGLEGMVVFLESFADMKTDYALFLQLKEKGVPTAIITYSPELDFCRRYFLAGATDYIPFNKDGIGTYKSVIDRFMFSV